MSSQVQPGRKYYQLTHDYLVHSLRDWLTRKQKETRRGRAELLLADRASVWNARQENRQLPSLLQWFQMKWLTKKKNWTPPQQKMMRKASRYHAVRGAILAFLVAVSIITGLRIRDQVIEREKANYAVGLVGRVFDANITQVPGIIKEMEAYRAWTDPLLHDAYAQAETDNDPRKQLHASLALLPVDSGQVDYLYGRLLQGQSQEVIVIREALSDHKQVLIERLWALLENPRNDQDQRFRAACALAFFSPDDPRWEKASPNVAATLFIQKPFVVAQWVDALKGVEKWLLPSLADFLVDENRSVSERSLIINVYNTYATDQPDAFAPLEKKLDEKNAPNASLDDKIDLAKKQVSIGVLLLVMGRGEKVWPLFEHRPDPTLRSYLIDRVGPGGVDAKVLISRLDEEKEVSARRAILLSLGEYGQDRLSQDQRLNLVPQLLQMYRDDPDPGIHGAAEWLLRQWQRSDEMKEIDKGLATGKVEGQRQWYINREGQTMVVVANAGEFWMGEGSGAVIRKGEEGPSEKGRERHRVQIGRNFAIASKEVTVEQFLRFRKEYRAPTSDCPVSEVSWYDAAAYCNWLSEQEGIPQEQWCYEPNEEGKYADGMKMTPNYLKRTGYRLPTEAEWEYSCRAGSETVFTFGESTELLEKYGWYNKNSLHMCHPVGSLKSNDLGLFDMHGNALEWCQEVWEENGKAEEDDLENISYKKRRVLCGGSIWIQASDLRSAVRLRNLPGNRNPVDGFRPARTFTP